MDSLETLLLEASAWSCLLSLLPAHSIPNDTSLSDLNKLFSSCVTASPGNAVAMLTSSLISFSTRAVSSAGGRSARQSSFMLVACQHSHARFLMIQFHFQLIPNGPA